MLNIILNQGFISQDILNQKENLVFTVVHSILSWLFSMQDFKTVSTNCS